MCACIKKLLKKPFLPSILIILSSFLTKCHTNIFWCQVKQCIVNLFFWQNPESIYSTDHQLYCHLPPISKAIQIRRTRDAGNCWRSKDELMWCSPMDLFSRIYQCWPTDKNNPYNRSVQTQDMVWKIYWVEWRQSVCERERERERERESQGNSYWQMTLNRSRCLFAQVSLSVSLFNGISTFVGYLMPKPSI